MGRVDLIPVFLCSTSVENNPLGIYSQRLIRTRFKACGMLNQQDMFFSDIDFEIIVWNLTVTTFFFPNSFHEFWNIIVDSLCQHSIKRNYNKIQLHWIRQVIYWPQFNSRRFKRSFFCLVRSRNRQHTICRLQSHKLLQSAQNKSMQINKIYCWTNFNGEH